MALRQVKLATPPAPVNTLQLSASPYIPGGSGRFRFKADEVRAFIAWICQRYQPGAVYGEFELAQAMGVHRVLANEWIGALVAQGYLESENVYKPVIDLQCLGFSVPDAVYAQHRGKAVALGFDKLVTYDPWTDRSLDGIVEDADRPYDFVDRFYSAYAHEHYLIIGKQRVRPNQTYFRPTTHDHVRELLAQPDMQEYAKLREAVSKAVSGDRTMLRPT